jgi:putative FmdB family regulatory protein
MPLYEYDCRGCKHRFELLVRTGDKPACPACQSEDLERCLSAFAVTTAGLSQSRLKEARASHGRSQKDRLIAEREEREHHQH